MGVPIFSLPQEWLWCETWCGADTRTQVRAGAAAAAAPTSLLSLHPAKLTHLPTCPSYNVQPGQDH